MVTARAFVVFVAITICPATAFAPARASWPRTGNRSAGGLRKSCPNGARIEKKRSTSKPGPTAPGVVGERDGKPVARDFVVSTKPGHKLITERDKDGEGVYARSPRYVPPPAQRWQGLATPEISRRPDRKPTDGKTLLGTLALPVLFPLGDNLSTKGSDHGPLRQAVDGGVLREGKNRLVFAYDSSYHGTVGTDGAWQHYHPRRRDVRPGADVRRQSFVRFVPGGKRPRRPLPLCKSVVYSAVDDKAGGKALLDIRIAFSDYSFEPPSDDKFYLSTYNLPEPVGVTAPKPIPTYLWFLIGAGVCGFAGLLLRYRARRLKTAEHKSVQTDTARLAGA